MTEIMLFRIRIWIWSVMAVFQKITIHWNRNGKSISVQHRLRKIENRSKIDFSDLLRIERRKIDYRSPSLFAYYVINRVNLRPQSIILITRSTNRPHKHPFSSFFLFFSRPKTASTLNVLVPIKYTIIILLIFIFKRPYLLPTILYTKNKKFVNFFNREKMRRKFTQNVFFQVYNLYKKSIKFAKVVFKK